VEALGHPLPRGTGLKARLGGPGDAFADEVAAELVVEVSLVVHGDLLVWWRVVNLQ
jgi:hypothetical protein